MSGPGCPRCHGVVVLYEGRPSVTATGHVELWHRTCWDVRHVPLPVAPPPRAPLPHVRGRRPWHRAAAVAAAAVGLVGAIGFRLAWAASEDAPPELGPGLAHASREPLAIRSVFRAREDAPPRASLRWKPVEDSDEVPVVNGVALDETFPSLRGWTHPVTASNEYMPTFYARLFGAERIGVERPECGAGHCGIDLDGPRGRPIVAVAPGMLVRVERREMGGDGRSGRYVRIRHEDGTLTNYMHLDDVAESLQEGQAVTRGQFVGTLGSTATYTAPPHLHFSLEIPVEGGGTRYINPSPFLMRSKIVPVIERQQKPALN